MKESFEEIVNILENRYKSYSPHHYDMFNLLAFGVEQNNATDNVFLVIDIQKRIFYIFSPVLYTSLCKIVFLNAPCIAYDNLINTNDLIKNIDESLKKYYNLKKSYLKTKVDYL